MIQRSRLSKEEFSLFSSYIEKQSGIIIDDTKVEALTTSLLSRIGAISLDDYLSYYYFLRYNRLGDEEFKELIDLITINETQFFRYKEQFEALKNQIIPELLRRKGAGQRLLRIWSAGCSTGEEPYSLAILVSEMGLIDELGCNVEILGTDISHSVLKTAETAVFSSWTMRLIEERLRDKYFSKIDDDKYVVNEGIRKMVKWAHHNLTKTPYPQWLQNGWDIILCRNVLIYFQTELVKEVIERFRGCLNEGGYLLVGHSESLYTVSDHFEVCRYEEAFFYQKPKPVASIEQRRIAEAALKSEQKLTASVDLRESLDHAMTAQNYERAMEIATGILEGDPNNVHALVIRAEVLTSKKMFEEAIEESNKALNIKPFLPEAHFILGIAYANIEKIDEAVNHFKRSSFIDKEFALAYLYLANIYRGIGNNSKAIVEYRKALNAIETNPNGDWLKYSGGYESEMLMRTCRIALQQLESESEKEQELHQRRR